MKSNYGKDKKYCFTKEELESYCRSKLVSLIDDEFNQRLNEAIDEYEKKTEESLAERDYIICERIINTFAIALNEEFGFGKIRAEKAMIALANQIKNNCKYNTPEVDVLDTELRIRLEQIGVDNDATKAVIGTIRENNEILDTNNDMTEKIIERVHDKGISDFSSVI